LRRWRICLAALALLVAAPVPTPAQTNAAAVAAAAQAFLATLTPAQSNAVIYAPTLTNAGRWSNFPDYEATRNGLKFSTLTETQRAAALAVAFTALSPAGTNLYEEIRAMEEYLRVNVNPVNYNSNFYYIAFVGAPGTNSPWLLQLSGHHISYNQIYQGPYRSGTPMFAGSEPNLYTNDAVLHMPLATQSNLIYTLRQTLTGAAQLSGTFTEVVFGVFPSTGHDDIFPKPYPTTGRGQLYTALTPDQQALVRAFMESYVLTMPEDLAASLLADYQSPAALAQTYVGYSGSADLSLLGSYFRVDGPRVWIELCARPGVAYPVAHWHSVWRDKLADYGAAFGTNSISTANRPPTITSSPASRTNEAGSSTTFTVAATGSGTLFYQWEKNAAAIPAATNASFTLAPVTHSDAAAYRCRVGNFMGHQFSAPATLTVPTTNPPALTATVTPDGWLQLEVQGDVGPTYLVETSTNLTSWESVLGTNPAVMPFRWLTPDPTNSAYQFYRVFYTP
jgi:hypothetical protein